MEILGIIPARGGSKSIKEKNIRKFNGLPLMAYTIMAAKKSKSIKRLIVSTNNKAIANVALKYGAEVPFLRPERLSTDSSLVSGTIIDLLMKLKSKEKYKPDLFILLQPTSPMRTAEDIDAAVKHFLKTKSDSLISICETEQQVFNMDKDFALKSANVNIIRSTNRQEVKKLYKQDGSMIYIIKTDLYLKTKSFYSGKLVGFVIERWRAVDIDEPQDFVVGELIHANSKKIYSSIKRLNNG